MTNHNPTPIRLSNKPTINGLPARVGQRIAIQPLGKTTMVTLTLHSEDFDIDWKALPPNVEIIAPEDIWQERAETTDAPIMVPASQAFTHQELSAFIENWRMTLPNRGNDPETAGHILDSLERYIDGVEDGQ